MTDCSNCMFSLKKYLVISSASLSSLIFFRSFPSGDQENIIICRIHILKGNINIDFISMLSCYRPCFHRGYMSNYSLFFQTMLRIDEFNIFKTIGSEYKCFHIKSLKISFCFFNLTLKNYAHKILKTNIAF